MNTSIKTLLVATLVMLLACTPAPHKPQLMTSGGCQMVWHGVPEATANTCPLPGSVKAVIIVLAKAPSLEAYQQQMAALDSFDFEDEQAILAIGFAESTYRDGYHLTPEETAALLKDNAFTLLLTDTTGTILKQSHRPVPAQALTEFLSQHP